MKLMITSTNAKQRQKSAGNVRGKRARETYRDVFMTPLPCDLLWHTSYAESLATTRRTIPAREMSHFLTSEELSPLRTQILWRCSP